MMIAGYLARSGGRNPDQGFLIAIGARGLAARFFLKHVRLLGA